VKEIVIYNTLKGRLETVKFEFADKNTTWFDDCEDGDIDMITDAFEGLLISEHGYNYPVLIDGISRSDIEYNQQKGLELTRQLI